MCTRHLGWGDHLSIEISTAIISGLVALVVALVGAILNLVQLRKEQDKWLADAKLAWVNELYKARIAHYPRAFEIMKRLSHGNEDPLTSEIAGQVALDINDWLYSAGGMCADATTRGAIIGLRTLCAEWSKDAGERPKDFMRFRNIAIRCLRRDLDLHENESYDFSDSSMMLNVLHTELRLKRKSYLRAAAKRNSARRQYPSFREAFQEKDPLQTDRASRGSDH